MVGSAIYTDEEIVWILERVITKVKNADIESGFMDRFHRKIGHSQIRYVKNKYGKDPRFNSPLINGRTATIPSPYLAELPSATASSAATTPGAGRANIGFPGAPPRDQRHAQGQAAVLPNPRLPQFQGGYYPPRAGVRRPREEEDQRPRPREVERASKRRRERELPLSPRYEPRIAPRPQTVVEGERGGEHNEEVEIQEESRGSSQDLVPTVQEHPSRRARRTPLSANAAPSLYQATAAAATIAAAAPAPRPVSRADLSSLSRSNPTPALWASQVQRAAALGNKAPMAAPESRIGTPHQPRAPYFNPLGNTASNRPDAASSYRPIRHTGDPSIPATDRRRTSGLGSGADASRSSAVKGSSVRLGDNAIAGDRGPRRRPGGGPVLDFTRGDNEQLSRSFQNNQFLPAATPRNRSHEHQPPGGVGKSGVNTARGTPYSRHGTVPRSSSSASGPHYLANAQLARQAGRPHLRANPMAGATARSEAVHAGNSRPLSDSSVVTGATRHRNAGTAAGNPYHEASTGFRDGLVRPGPGGSQVVTNLPNLNRPPGSGFAADHPCQPVHQREASVPETPRRKRHLDDLCGSREAMLPPPMPQRVEQPPPQAAAPSSTSSQAPAAGSPGILSREWLQARYSEDEIRSILFQFQNDPQYPPFPFDSAPSPSPPPSQVQGCSPPSHVSQLPLEKKSSKSAATGNSPPVQQPVASASGPPGRPTPHAPTLATDCPTWISSGLDSWGSAIGEISTPRDTGLGHGAVDPYDLLLNFPDMGELQYEQMAPETEQASLGQELFQDTDFQNVGALLQDMFPVGDMSDHLPVCTSLTSGNLAAVAEAENGAAVIQNDPVFYDASDIYESEEFLGEYDWLRQVDGSGDNFSEK